jgi:hypothetical protein
LIDEERKKSNNTEQSEGFALSQEEKINMKSGHVQNMILS